MFRDYHYLVAGLVEFSFEDKTNIPKVSDFKILLKDHLHRNDFKLLQLFFLEYDNQNVLSFLKIKKHEFYPSGNYTVEDFEEAIAQYDTIAYEEAGLPEYLSKFITTFHSESVEKKNISWENQLLTLYYEHVLKCPNTFIRNWFEFELNLRNALTAVTCRKFGYSAEKEIIGTGIIAQQLKSNPAKDFGLNVDFPLIDRILQITELQKIIDKERNIDLLKWSYLDEQTTFHYFDVEYIASYLIKLKMVNRWLKLDQETGRTMFNRMISDIEKSYEFPEEFKV
jgi:hypothetical protein